MALAFPLGPIRHAFTPTKPLSPNSSCSVPPLPATWITRPSAELQPTCWAKGSWVFRCHNKNRSVPHSFTDAQTLIAEAFLSAFLFIFMTCSLPLPHPFLHSDVWRDTDGSTDTIQEVSRRMLRLSALTFLMLRQVSKLARHMSPYYNDLSPLLNLISVRLITLIQVSTPDLVTDPAT